MADANPYDLGYSRRKLLALASVLAMRTPILILDEPTTGQDARGVARVRAVVAGAAAEGRTVIAISHDMRFVAECFGRVVVMRAGQVALDGPPADVFGEPAWPELRASYLEPPLPAVAGARLGLGSTPTEAAARGGARGRPAEPVAYGAMRVLVLNPGSSSLKSSVIETAAIPAPAAGRPRRSAGRSRRWARSTSTGASTPLPGRTRPATSARCSPGTRRPEFRRPRSARSGIAWSTAGNASASRPS